MTVPPPVSPIDLTDTPSDAALRLNVALASASIGTWVWDVKKNWVVGDRNLVRMFSVPPEYAGGAPIGTFLAAVHPEDVGPLQELIGAVLDSEHGQFEMDYRVRQPDGSIRWIVARGTVQRDASGAPTLFPGVAVDITDRKLAEGALRETAERLRLTLAASDLGDWSWDAKTDLMTLSPRTREIYGLPAGKHFTRAALRTLVIPQDADLTRLTLQTALEKHEDYVLEYRIVRPSGEHRWVAARGRADYAADGTVIGMIGVVQDITASRSAQEGGGRRAGLVAGGAAPLHANSLPTLLT
jgi:PAS domain S-box-containing protein